MISRNLAAAAATARPGSRSRIDPEASGRVQAEVCLQLLFPVRDREEVSQLFGRIEIGCHTAWINLTMRFGDEKFAGIVEPAAIIVRHWHWHVGGRLDGKR